jgi:predicted ribosome quality control (RQC) complex YloA/Tae2 family protein
VTDSAGEHYVPGAVLEALEGRVKAAGRKLRSLERELDSAPDPASLRGKGDLILARIGEIPRGASEVRLVDFDGQTVTLELDPSLDAAANARGYYDRAGRGERARRELPARIEEARTALAAEQSRLAAAREGTIPAEIVLEGLSPAGPGDKGGKGRTALPYRVFRSSGGLEIRVGRGARHNDTLTFQHARPMDVWLHARNVGGAHVVLRWDREERPPARDLEEAAVLAALNSRARTSGSVAVDWTRRKWVRKPRKGRSGQVLVERAETLFVAPDPQVGEALQVSEDGDQPDR